VLIEDGRIAEIAPQIRTTQSPIVNAEGCIVARGWWTFTFTGARRAEYKEDTRTLTASAAAGGVTSVCVMPNTQPTIDRASIVADVLHRAAPKATACESFIASVSIDASTSS
jgi:dihydroorotase